MRRAFYERAHGAGRDGVHRRNAKLRALPGRGVLRGAPLRRGSAHPVLPEKTAPDRKPASTAFTLVAMACAVQRRADTGLLASMWEPAERPFCRTRRKPASPAARRWCTFSASVEWHMRGYIVRCKRNSGLCLGDASRAREAPAMPTAFRYYRKNWRRWDIEYLCIRRGAR